MNLTKVFGNSGKPNQYRIDGMGRMKNITATYDKHKNVLHCVKRDSRGAKRAPAKTDMPVIEKAIHQLTQ